MKTPEDQMNPKKQKEIRQEDGNRRNPPTTTQGCEMEEAKSMHGRKGTSPVTTAKHLFGELRMIDLWREIKGVADSATITVQGLCPLGGPYLHTWKSRAIRVSTFDEAGETEDNSRSPCRNVGRRKGVHFLPPEEVAWKEGCEQWTPGVFVQFKEKIVVKPTDNLTIDTQSSDCWSVQGWDNREKVSISFCDSKGKPLANPLLLPTDNNSPRP